MSEFALELLDITCTFWSPDDAAQRYKAVSKTTLRIRSGEFVSVVGPTGCGKSTLLNIGAGLLPPSSGKVKVFGQPLAGSARGLHVSGRVADALAQRAWTLTSS